jgi:hypothetical protein
VKQVQHHLQGRRKDAHNVRSAHAAMFCRQVLFDVPEHECTSSLSADTWDVEFDFGHIEPQFRVLRAVGESRLAP